MFLHGTRVLPSKEIQNERRRLYRVCVNFGPAALRLLRYPKPHEWLLLAVLLCVTDRYRWMMDDAFVYFRYVDNLLFLGRGLVYNPGEYVEGFSSPAWTLLLVPLRALGIDYWTIVRALALAFALSYGAALIWLNRRLSPLPTAAESPIFNFPLAASAAHYGITTHFSSGLETPLVQLLAPLYAAALLKPRSAWLQCLVALAPLIRAECALLCVLYLGFVLLKTRRLPWWFFGFGLAANGGWLMFRVFYFADFLPNTFYLKDTAQWSLGFAYWVNVETTHDLLWWLFGLSMCALLGRRRLRGEAMPRATMAVGALLYGVYVARIGGDMLYHRYAALPVCLGLCASAGFVEAALAVVDDCRHSRITLLLAAVSALLVCLLFGLRYPPQLTSHPLGLPRGSRKWGRIADPNWHRSHAKLVYNDERAREDKKQLDAYARRRAAGEPKNAKIVAEGLCVDIFRAFDTVVVHDYGLTDPVLARLPRTFGRPGHKLVQIEAGELVQLKRAARAKGTEWYNLPNAPRWVRDNREALPRLEEKLHNQHHFFRNFELARMRLKLK